MAIVLGRDCSISVGGSTVTGVRSVTFNVTSDEESFVPYGSRFQFAFPTSIEYSVSFETNDDSSSGFINNLEDGDELSITVAGMTFTGVVVSVSINQPLDGVESYSVALKRTYIGTRSS